MYRIAFIGFLIFAGIVHAKDVPPKEGSYYAFDQLGISKTEFKAGKIALTFKPTQEEFHWCPGIKVQKTKKATVVTFVRCKTSQTCGIDKKAKIGKKLVRTISINTNGLDVYVRSGAKKFKRIYTSPNSQPSTKTKNTSTNRKKQSGRSRVLPRALNPQNDFVELQSVRNLHVNQQKNESP